MDKKSLIEKERALCKKSDWVSTLVIAVRPYATKMKEAAIEITIKDEGQPLSTLSFTWMTTPSKTAPRATSTSLTE